MADNRNEQLKRISIRDFQQKIRKEDDAEPTKHIVHKNLGGSDSVKQIDSKNRRINFTITTGAIDRDNDTIDPDGWDLKAFKKNPVVLWAHDASQLPIGKARKIRKKDGSLEAETEFTPADLNEFGHTVFRLYEEGFLNAVSVGFRPTEVEIPDDEDRGLGLDFTEQELMEFSAVPVPSNPEALIQARSKGINTEPIKEWAEKTLDNWEEERTKIWVPRHVVENVHKCANGRSRQVHLSKSDQKSLRQQNLARIAEQATKKHEEDKSAITFGQAHSDGTPKAARDADWDGDAEIKEADVDDLKVMATWKASKSDDELNKSDFKLPHHKASGQHSVVWRGVTAAMGSLLGARGGVDIPDDDRKSVYNHLAKHYEEFDEEPPEFKNVEDQVISKEGVVFDMDNGQVTSIKEVIDFDAQEKLFYVGDEKDENSSEKDILLSLSFAKSEWNEDQVREWAAANGFSEESKDGESSLLGELEEKDESYVLVTEDAERFDKDSMYDIDISSSEGDMKATLAEHDPVGEAEEEEEKKSSEEEDESQVYEKQVSGLFALDKDDEVETMDEMPEKANDLGDFGPAYAVIIEDGDDKVANELGEVSEEEALEVAKHALEEEGEDNNMTATIAVAEKFDGEAGRYVYNMTKALSNTEFTESEEDQKDQKSSEEDEGKEADSDSSTQLGDEPNADTGSDEGDEDKSSEDDESKIEVVVISKSELDDMQETLEKSRQTIERLEEKLDDSGGDESPESKSSEEDETVEIDDEVAKRVLGEETVNKLKGETSSNSSEGNDEETIEVDGIESKEELKKVLDSAVNKGLNS